MASNVPPPPPPAPGAGGFGGAQGGFPRPPQIVNLPPGVRPPGAIGPGGPHPGSPPPPGGILRPGMGGSMPGMPGGHFGPGPGPQQMQMQMPIRNSTRVSDITPKKLMDESACKKQLTTYEAHTMRKVLPREAKEKSTWAKVELAREPLAQDDISKQVKKLNEGKKKTVADKKAALFPFQQGQINRLLDDLKAQERNPNFEWSLAQIDRKERTIKGGMRETTVITVFVKRCVVDGVNPMVVYQNEERMKAQRMEAMNRPMPQPVHHPGGPQIVHPPNGAGPVKALPKPKSKGSDTSSEFDGDSESDSDYSSIGTSISSRSGRRARRYSHGHNHKGRPRSHSRRREHTKQYYITDRIRSPEPPRFRESWSGGQAPHYVPEIPRAVVPAFDPVAAAYQAGKIDADAERLERYVPPPRVSPRLEPRALVTYDRPGFRHREVPYDIHRDVHRRYEDRRYEDRLNRDRFDRVDRFDRYADRFADDRYHHARDHLRDDHLYPSREEMRRREAEEYIDRRPPSPRIIYDRPFSPIGPHRRYPPSSSSGW